MLSHELGSNVGSYARDVATRSSQRNDEPLLDRAGSIEHHNWDGPSLVFQGLDGLRVCADRHIHLQGHELRRVLREALRYALSCACLHNEVPSLLPAELAQGFDESLAEVRIGWSG